MYMSDVIGTCALNDVYLYEDDGDGYGYREGAYRMTEFVVTGPGESVEATVVEGDWEPGVWRIVPRDISKSEF